MSKKWIIMLTAFCLVFTCTFGGASAFAYGNTDESEAAGRQPVPAVLSDETEYIRDPESGYIYPAEEESIPESETAVANPEGRNRAALPPLYPPGDVSEILSKYPATRAQSPYGTCWSHAAVACTEFDLVKNHGYSRSLDLSELQLAYFTYHTANDRLGNLDGDVNYIPNNAVENYLDMGGNMSFALQTLAQWKGLTYENVVPYSNAAESLSSGLATGYAQRSDGAKMENAYVLDIKNNPTAVKEAIRTYGAVDASYYHDSKYYSINGYALYYCSNGSVGTNHDIAIVGWNDNLPASAFPSNNRPSQNGAWLVRNSWSTANNGSEYCYFWMSYGDKSLAKTVYAWDFVPGTKYANIYQHDGTTAYSSIGIEKAANIFTVENPDNAGSVALQAVMMSFMSDTDVSYQIDIYTGQPGTLKTNPEKGYHHSYATTTGTTTYAGVRTVYLKQPVYLSPGETYAIVVTSRNGQHWFDTEVSRAITYQDNGSTVGWFTSTSYAASGESLYKTYASYNGWADAATDGLSSNGNFRIKGLTTNSSAKKYTVSYDLNSGKLSGSNPAWYFSTTSAASLKTPTRSGYHFLGWYEEGTNTKITSLSGSLGRNLQLYAKWCADDNTRILASSLASYSDNGSYYISCKGCGKESGPYTTYRVDSVKLNYTKLTYTGENRNPYPVIKDANGNKLEKNTDYTYKYSKSTRKSVGRYYVTITFNPDKYNIASKKLYYTVVPKAPSSASAKLYGYDDVKVSWSKCTGASGYYVYYKKSTSSSYSNYKRTTGTSLKFSNLSDNVKYNFKIVPYYKSGDTRYKSTKYKVVSTTTLKKLAQPSMSRISGGKVSLDWECISGASGYQVYWSTSKSGTYKKLCDYSSKYSGVSFTVGKGETYWYKTRAYKKVGDSKIYGPWSTPKKFIR